MSIWDSIKSFANGNEQEKTAQVKRGITGIKQAINPFDDESRGNALVNQTSREFKATPQFKNILDRVNPTVGGSAQVTGGLKGSRAAGLYYPKGDFSDMNNRMWLAQNNPNNSEIMQHEGLHAAWDESTPEVQQQYLDTLDRVLPQNTLKPRAVPFRDQEMGPRAYLMERTGNYVGRQGSTQNIRGMNRNIQNEIHSYVPEYYQQTGEQMPQELKNYYSRYYTPGNYERMNRILSPMRAATRSPGGNILDMLDY